MEKSSQRGKLEARAGQGSQAGSLTHLSIAAQGPPCVAIQPTGSHQQLTYPPQKAPLVIPMDLRIPEMEQEKTQESEGSGDRVFEFGFASGSAV